MGTTYLDDKIIDLQARLNSESKINHSDNLAKDLTINALCSPRYGSGRKPKQLGDIGTPLRTRKQLNLPVTSLMQHKTEDSSEVDSKMKEIMKMNGILNINGEKYFTDIKSLEHLGDLGNGTCGNVVKMLHKPSNTAIAVKQMRRSGNNDDNKRIIMDLDVVFKSLDCPYIVRYLGSFITESDVWICMELMATCFDRLLKKLKCSIAEDILGKVALSTVKALHYLKESHGIIHRDVKPSNILLDEKGNVKLCDFGISGRLVDSKAKTKNAGCAAYMAPERIEPPDPRRPDYDIRADVWSLGITLVELATGAFPYKDCKCDFEVLSRVLNEDPPTLPADPSRFSAEFQNFVSCCLTKDYKQRPKYKKLLEHPFLKRYEVKYVDVASWYSKAVSVTCTNTPLRFSQTSLSSSTRQQPPPTPPQSTVHQSRRTGLENIVFNGDQSRKYSPSCSSDTRYANGLQNDWDKFNTNKWISSPLFLRKRYVPEMSYATNNTSNNNSNTSHVSGINGYNDSGSKSPLVLQRFYHQRNQHLNNHQSSYLNSSPSHYRSSSLSPSRKYFTESLKLVEESKPYLYDGTKNIYSSYLKFNNHADNQRSPSNIPSPAPPSPPPRLNKSVLTSSPGNAFSSPLMMKRNYYENPSSSLAYYRLLRENSPLLSRR